jgi:hypothetical protein
LILNASEVAELAETVVQAINLLPIIASPRLYERWKMEAPPVELHKVLLAGLSGLRKASESWKPAQGEGAVISFERAKSQIQAFWEAVSATQPGDPLEPAWSEHARACLSALGLPEPEGGWEHFQGEWQVGGTTPEG